MKENSVPFRAPAPKTFSDQVQEVMSAASNVENKFIQNVIVKKDEIDINLFTKSMIKYMQIACISSSSKAVFSVDNFRSIAPAKQNNSYKHKRLYFTGVNTMSDLVNQSVSLAATAETGEFFKSWAKIISVFNW